MKMTENEKNSFNQNSTSCSTSSSTDSGVIIIDNTTTFNGDNANAKTTRTTKTTTSQSSPTDKNKRKQQETNNYSNAADNNKNTNATTKINIENFINISKTSSGNAEQRNGPPQTATMPTTPATERTSKANSPAVSIRSTTISIVSIDENAIDSSVVDSDSDFEDDTEGVHSNYIVKKLGQQTTYPANSPDIPNINKGLTVISQQISANDAAPGVVPLANKLLNGAIANVGGGGSAGTLAPQSTTPQIGSIALSNSTDVTFGDKHFYEGPVTIQQFLIDNREKWKDENGQEGQDNPMFQPGSEGKHAASGELDPTSKSKDKQTPKSYHLLFNRKALIITGVITLLTIVIGALILANSNVFKSSTTQSFDGKLKWVSREEWHARPHKGVMDKLKLPVHRVIISHTATDACYERNVCANRLQVIQSFHMDSMNWDDIGYNFLIGADGFVYIGRGWDNQGAHTKGYNRDSVGISFIGTYTTVSPNESQLGAAQLLIAEGVRLGKIVPDYRLYGARQLSATESPGSALYQIIQTWSKWSANV